MSEDEAVILVVFAIIAACGWWNWLVGCCRADRARASSHARLTAVLLPILCSVMLLVVLRLWSSADVRTSTLYTFFYMVFGAAWIGLAVILQPMHGLSLRDDVLERRNVAALAPICGSMVGLTFCFAGANIGDGPGWWVVLYCALVSTAEWLVFWSIYNRLTHAADHVTIDRDPAAGWRMAGYLVASGMIFGRAVAGDWTSASGTIRDAFFFSWPALLLLIAAVLFENIFRPTPQRPAASQVLGGHIPALMYVAAAAIWLVFKGPGNN